MKQVTKLKNKYTGDIVHCHDMKDVVVHSNITFLRVHNPENPARVYLANKDAFVIITK